MKARTVFLLAAVALLLAGSVALAQSAKPQAAYVIQQAALSGGRYHLTGPGWQFSGMSSGGRYYLLGPVMAEGYRCCCTYLPCVMRQSP